MCVCVSVCVCWERGVGGGLGGGEAVRVCLGTIISGLLGASGYEMCPSELKNIHRLGVPEYKVLVSLATS